MTSKVEQSSEINDIRSSTTFKGISFSNFKKTEVKQQFINNMKKGKVEPAEYWAAELICAGHYLEVWEIILHFFSKYIHLGNPKIAIYLEMRYTIFKNIMQQGLYLTELQLRNHSGIRKLFAEVICILTLSNRKPSFEQIKIVRAEEFDITQIGEKLKADSVQYIEPFFKKDDGKELMIALNEFAYSLTIRNMSMACYWLEWIIEFDVLCKIKKQPIKCERRNYPVEIKYTGEPIWIIWDVLCGSIEKETSSNSLRSSTEPKTQLNDLSMKNEVRNGSSTSKLLQKTMNALMSLFCIKYSSGSSKKRRYLLYMAIGLITEHIEINAEIIANKPILENVVNRIDQIYKQIKKNEVSPGTEYLFNNLESENNFEKTIQKMELFNSMDII